MLRDLLKQEGIEIGRKHVATLMRRMGIEALMRRRFVYFVAVMDWATRPGFWRVGSRTP